jgi:Secretion system C-terminal sorting domain
MKTLLLLLLIVVVTTGYYTETLAQNFTAHHYNYLADSLIKVIAPSAKLLTIESDSTFYGGTSHTWNYRYESWNGQNPTYYFLHTTQNSVVYDSSNNNIILVSITYVTLPWIDSDSAWVIAEAQGGSNFRLLHPHNKILASLQEAVVPNSKPSWYLIYRSLDNANDYVSFILDATDSSKITGVNLLGKTGLNTFRLQQNYPNPFNPNTLISYSIPSASNIKLIVYNTLGQKVKDLENGFKNAGNYSVNFNASDLPSGIYFYKLEAGQFSQVKKMILLK